MRIQCLAQCPAHKKCLINDTVISAEDREKENTDTGANGKIGFLDSGGLFGLLEV